MRQRGGGDTERERQRNISHNITVSYFLTSQLKASGHILYCYSPHSKAGREEFKRWFNSKLKQNYARVWYHFPLILLFVDKNF